MAILFQKTLTHFIKPSAYFSQSLFVKVIHQAKQLLTSTAIVSGGEAFTYQQLITRSQEIATAILKNTSDLQEARIAFMVSPGFDYVATLWGIWQAGGVVVPLCLTHPPLSLHHTLKDSVASCVITSAEFQSVLEPIVAQLPVTLLMLSDVDKKISTLPEVSSQRRAMILYTSGTTNLPKGVVTTHKNIEAQIAALVNAWHWNNHDHTLCILPLHHVHGIVNVICCSLWVGATCEFLPSFDAANVFHVFMQGRVNVFMAVPTIYYKLVAYWETLPQNHQQEIGKILLDFRLMVSGSAALPESVMENWKKISGHILLERYGMTELGMAISNPYIGERKAGHVGLPLPGVSIRLCNERDETVNDEPGEIQVKGDNVFLEYWNKPEETSKNFTLDGWFRTGDVAVLNNGYYRIMGRSSVDIIKSGGYKISALEIEEVLRQHPSVSDCSVVGLDSEEWGELVAAALIATEPLDIQELTHWLKERMPGYRIPRKFLFVNELPRNAMGKVTKNDVKKLFTV